MHLTFHGAAGEVTGSCYLLEAAGSRVLLDCGLIQGGPKDEARNSEPFAFDPASIDAVILSHAHIDHSGRIPLLIKSGFRGKIFTHGASVDLCQVMLRDSGYLQEKDAEWENRKRERKGLKLVQPLYTAKDAEIAIDSFVALEYGKPTQVVSNIEVCLHDAGHILGSSIVDITVSEKGKQKRLVFSGDLGQSGVPILRDPAIIHNADLLLLESTYGDRCHKDQAATYAEIGQVLTEANARQGKILIPAFAVGRTQELLYLFARHHREWGMQNWQIFLDSPLAISATEIYEKHHRVYDKEAAALYKHEGFRDVLPNLRYVRTAEESIRLNQIHAGAIIIAGSGMCTGGRIRHHLKHNVWRKQTHIMMVGFQARGTTGRALVDGARYIRLWGETIKVEAQVHTIGGLSAHADQRDLLQWLGHFKPLPPTYLVHGEETALTALQSAIKTHYDHQAHIARPGEQVEI
ncbi:MAG: MBL fold metallo-hydrolase [Gammaproteobacteria bacterium]